jgi:hypothetical protein
MGNPNGASTGAPEAQEHVSMIACILQVNIHRSLIMIEETIEHRGTTLIRRLVLAHGEATRWHRDPFERVTVVLQGERLAIEYRDGTPAVHVDVRPGLIDRDRASDRVHRAVNVGTIYEQVVVFFLNRPDDDPQPSAS